MRRDPTFRPPPILNPDLGKDRLGRSGDTSGFDTDQSESAFCRFCGGKDHQVDTCPKLQYEPGNVCPECGVELDEDGDCTNPTCSKVNEELDGDGTDVVAGIIAPVNPSFRPLAWWIEQVRTGQKPNEVGRIFMIKHHVCPECADTLGDVYKCDKGCGFDCYPELAKHIDYETAQAQPEREDPPHWTS